MTDMLTDTGNATLDFDSLPPRAHALDPDELSDVFGGCTPAGLECHGDKECCQNWCQNDVCVL